MPIEVKIFFTCLVFALVFVMGMFVGGKNAPTWLMRIYRAGLVITLTGMLLSVLIGTWYS